MGKTCKRQSFIKLKWFGIGLQNCSIDYYIKMASRAAKWAPNDDVAFGTYIKSPFRGSNVLVSHANMPSTIEIPNVSTF